VYFDPSGFKPVCEAHRAGIIRHKKFVPGMEAAPAVPET